MATNTRKPNAVQCVLCGLTSSPDRANCYFCGSPELRPVYTNKCPTCGVSSLQEDPTVRRGVTLGLAADLFRYLTHLPAKTDNHALASDARRLAGEIWAAYGTQAETLMPKGRP